MGAIAGRSRYRGAVSIAIGGLLLMVFALMFGTTGGDRGPCGLSTS